MREGVRLTRRGEVVLALGVAALTLLALLGLFRVAVSVHWTDQGYCWGSFVECSEKEEGK